MPQVISVEDRFGKWLKHSNRSHGARVSTIVLHHDAGASALSTINYLRKPLTLASYHYLIERDGVIWKCVPGTKKAWHAGLSRGPFGENVNDYSIGICLSNRGTGSEPYPEAQIASALWLIDQVKLAYPSLKYITTHRLITRRKIDPAGFDFKTFAVGSRLKPWMDESLGRPWNG